MSWVIYSVIVRNLSPSGREVISLQKVDSSLLVFFEYNGELKKGFCDIMRRDLDKNLFESKDPISVVY